MVVEKLNAGVAVDVDFAGAGAAEPLPKPKENAGLLAVSAVVLDDDD